jgi:hypothetical protein
MVLVLILMTLWLCLGGLGMLVLTIFILSVIVGGMYDLYRCLADHRGESRRAGGLCARCGYDMRASPRCCPECGLPTDVLPRRPRFLST